MHSRSAARECPERDMEFARSLHKKIAKGLTRCAVQTKARTEDLI